jgi:predicted 2-oxoglutarate/Fe(II)-dependent dioxygenase YbiX
MIGFKKSLVDQTDLDFLFDLYRNSTNWDDERQSERHAVSIVGHLLVSSFTQKEIEPIWSKVKNTISAQLGCDIELAYARILKYNKTCFIQKHLDTYRPEYQKESDISLILQLNDPNDYVGGAMIVNKQLIELQPGDAVYYTYDEVHEVKVIKSGIRYVLNLRFKRVK